MKKNITKSLQDMMAKRKKKCYKQSTLSAEEKLWNILRRQSKEKVRVLEEQYDTTFETGYDV